MTIIVNPHTNLKIGRRPDGLYHLDYAPQHNFKMYKVKRKSFTTPVCDTAQEAYDQLWAMRCAYCDANPDAQNILLWFVTIRPAPAQKGGWIGTAGLSTGRARKRPTSGASVAYETTTQRWTR